ncbi:bifunctional phosphoribosyl-AMP cyclohydrolase/phosphoribosyl-ATP diphosphatase HisIE [Anaerosacchariphilus polymeriproducens]|uniref:Histidine biosynthesis bifunctional protein HisIE n=1 Tax=Anaerosacchariphilus polymeriproducens TaxID=1812858 RepID=A0A371ATZ7_9FIRM|nr:bifunctional phosphoribosyl-AMP cyclohydrolase/phosphoribosyl-ATP diphosphatase HisIE [Anaerosacchariphilus polymeriproducens]RDU23033.1 bifunctional phosphoribosyl-AMP cyclohydrolase/phosphoribosyl-ATP diphosphatase HisIE [Anaerosacchariphilus polymeriproducens]
MNYKKLVACIYILNGKAVKGFEAGKLIDENPIELAHNYSDNGADEILIFNLSNTDTAHEQTISIIKQITQIVDIPVLSGGHINKMEDVKKLLYAGCSKAILNFNKPENVKLLEEVSKRFGKDKIACAVDYSDLLESKENMLINYASEIFLFNIELLEDLKKDITLPVIPVMKYNSLEEMRLYLKNTIVSGVANTNMDNLGLDYMELKKKFQEDNIPMNILKSKIAWTDFKLNSDGMIPVIVQDYKTDEVLMLAYMNEEAFQKTLSCGKMTYWSRSRNELWTKGDTSGHVQYVKELLLDCDNDTILAKVSQVGVACHTGNKTCFFQEIMKKEGQTANPLKVFEEVYKVIQDRKSNPKEGSYTNYLFDKGIDKILKKLGEEATEIVIAAKNPDAEEIKYEISDFLYHAMVLMVEKEISWEDITKELATR